MLAYRLDLSARLVADQKIDDAEKVLQGGVAADPQANPPEVALVQFLATNRSLTRRGDGALTTHRAKPKAHRP